MNVLRDFFKDIYHKKKCFCIENSHNMTFRAKPHWTDIAQICVLRFFQAIFAISQEKKSCVLFSKQKLGQRGLALNTTCRG